MGKLIDTTELFNKVSEITDVPVHTLTNHMTLVEVIVLLVNEIEDIDQYNDDLIEEMQKLLPQEEKPFNAEDKDKPTWMNKEEK
jgi:uncharacterized protein YjfI (DUF2170 family)